MEKNIHTIDATNRVLGRLATEVAVLLRGKHKPDFVPYKNMGDFVVIKNIEKIKITGKKLRQKIYYRHSGYPGGLKKIPMSKLFAENPRKVFIKAVSGMLPKNKLRPQQMKKLKFI